MKGQFYFQDGDPDFSDDIPSADDEDWKEIRQAAMFTPTSGTRINLVSSFASNYISKVLTNFTNR